jgi:hypothetical protein
MPNKGLIGKNLANKGYRDIRGGLARLSEWGSFEATPLTIIDSLIIAVVV